MLDSDEEDYECPLCMEELDIADRNFKPCTCGYQVSVLLCSARKIDYEPCSFRFVGSVGITLKKTLMVAVQPGMLYIHHKRKRSVRFSNGILYSRREYSDQMVEFEPVSADEYVLLEASIE